MFIENEYMAKVALVVFMVMIGLVLLLFILLIPKKNAKNKAKQEAKERAEADKILGEPAKGYAPRDCKERVYKAFTDFKEDTSLN